MGRIFEKRKHKIFARMDKMAKAFTRIGKDIAIAVKQSGPDPNNNPRLRMAIQNAKSVNMPKDRVESAIKRAVAKDTSNYEEIVYQGYAPHGVAVVVECATDNPTRTVANIRLYFSRAEGSMGKMGSLDFLFERKGIFKIKMEGKNKDEMELELIDMGADEIEEVDGELIVYTKFSDFGSMQKKLEEKGITILNSEAQFVPNSFAEISEEQEKTVMKMIDEIEEDDDVQAVFHNMK